MKVVPSTYSVGVAFHRHEREHRAITASSQQVYAQISCPTYRPIELARAREMPISHALFTRFLVLAQRGRAIHALQDLVGSENFAWRGTE